jgi:hypothetical protein
VAEDFDEPGDREEGPDVDFRFDIPAEWKTGAYANNVNIWHSPYEFTLDFAVTEPPELNPEDPDAPVTVPNAVVARIKIPVGLAFNLIRALNDNMTAYEQQWGEIKGPEPQEDEE